MTVWVSWRWECNKRRPVRATDTAIGLGGTLTSQRGLASVTQPYLCVSVRSREDIILQAGQLLQMDVNRSPKALSRLIPD